MAQLRRSFGDFGDHVHSLIAWELRERVELLSGQNAPEKTVFIFNSFEGHILCRNILLPCMTCRGQDDKLDS